MLALKDKNNQDRQIEDRKISDEEFLNKIDLKEYRDMVDYCMVNGIGLEDIETLLGRENFRKTIDDANYVGFKVLPGGKVDHRHPPVSGEIKVGEYFFDTYIQHFQNIRNNLLSFMAQYDQLDKNIKTRFDAKKDTAEQHFGQIKDRAEHAWEHGKNYWSEEKDKAQAQINDLSQKFSEFINMLNEKKKSALSKKPDTQQSIAETQATSTTPKQGGLLDIIMLNGKNIMTKLGLIAKKEPENPIDQEEEARISEASTEEIAQIDPRLIHDPEVRAVFADITEKWLKYLDKFKDQISLTGHNE